MRGSREQDTNEDEPSFAFDQVRAIAERCRDTHPETWIARLCPAIFPDPMKLATVLVHKPSRYACLFPPSLAPPWWRSNHHALAGTRLSMPDITVAYRAAKACTSAVVTEEATVINGAAYILYSSNQDNLLGRWK